MKAVLLDMDGTLIDTERVWMNVWDLLEKEFHFTISQEDRLRFVGLPKQEFPSLCKRVLPSHVDIDVFDSRRAELFEVYIQENGLAVRNGAIEFLSWCHQQGYLCVVVTSTFRQKALERLRIAKLIPFFDQIITGDQIQKGKPDPEIYQLALQTLGLKAMDCIAVEDTRVGMQSATQAGIITYWMLDLIGPQQKDLEQVVAVCEDFIELKRRLEETI